MITLKNYLMGREASYTLSDLLVQNAEVTIIRANQVLNKARAAGVVLHINPRTLSLVASGWRPPEVNASTPGAAALSKHMTCEAVDIYDPEGTLDDFVFHAPELLEYLNLWLEHPAATKNWCHLQTKPPRSGRRVFYP